MCGRYTLRNPQPLKDRFSLENLEKRYNIAPGQRILAVDNNSSDNTKQEIEKTSVQIQ